MQPTDPWYALNVMQVPMKKYIESIQTKLLETPLFYGHGTDNAWDEACWLVETLMRRAGIADFTEETQVSSKVQKAVDELLQRRINERLPLAYLLKEAWFAGLSFYVDERVLVPRSPFAELIASGFEGLLKTPPKRILDLCTGSGCIGIACAMAFPDAEVELADLSPEALEVARINIERYELQERVTVVQSDLLERLEGRYDLIVSNPPYVPQAEYDELPSEYLQEPQMGLVSENNGLAIPLQILRESPDYLNKGGILILETGNSWQALQAAVPELPLLWLDFEYGGEGICVLGDTYNLIT